MKYIIAFLMVVLITGCGQSSKETSVVFIENAKAGNHTEMFNMLSSKYQSKVRKHFGSINDSTLKGFYKAGQIISYSLNVIAESDTKSEIEALLVTKDNKSHRTTIKLVNDNGSWKVSRF